MNNVIEMGKEKKRRVTSDRRALETVINDNSAAEGMMKALLERYFKQKVTIDGQQVEYSVHDLFNEVQRHTNLCGPRKGYSEYLRSVSHGAVLKDIAKIRGITADTLFHWLMEKMQDAINYGPDSWQDVKENCEGEFYIAMQDVDELKEAFYDAVKAEQEVS